MPDFGDQSLTRQVTTSTLWIVAGRWIIRLLGLVSTVVLARLLTPEDYGIVALAFLVTMVLEALTDFRFDRALIRYQDATEDEFNTAWTLNVIRGLVIATILYAGSWSFAGFFHEPQLVGVIWVLALSAVLDGLQNIGMVQYQRDLRFDREIAFRVGPKLSGAVVTIALAFVWRSYWALVCGLLAASVARLLLSFVMHPFRPRVLVSAWHRLFAFSGWLMASQSISLVNQRLEQFLIGRFLPASAVGIYNIAYELGSMATVEVVGPAAHALFPGFSKIATDRERLCQAYEKSVQFLVAIGTPLGVGLALVAGEFVAIVLGEKWVEVVMPLQVLSVMFSLTSVAIASTGILPALGRTRDVFFIELVQFIIRIPITAAIVWNFGLVSAAWARFAFGLWWVVQYVLAVRKAIDFSLKRMLAATCRSYGACAVMAVTVFLVGSFLGTASGRAAFSAPVTVIWASFAIKVLTGTVTYVLAHFALWQLQGRPEGPESLIIQQIAIRLRSGK